MNFNIKNPLQAIPAKVIYQPKYSSMAGKVPVRLDTRH